MNVFQISMLVLAGLLGLSVLPWDKILTMIKPVPKPAPDELQEDLIIKEVVDHHPHASKTNLLQVVSCWENLKLSCEEHGLSDASEELDKIFPLFVGIKDQGVPNV